MRNLTTFILLFWFNLALAQPYCTTNLGGGSCQSYSRIDSVSIVGTTLQVKGNYCATSLGNALTVFPDTGSATCTLSVGQTYILKVNLSAQHNASFWIDFNHNFLYEASEWKQICTNSTAGTTYTISFTVPFSGYAGQTGMRVRSAIYTQSNTGTDACTPHPGSGETEDYTITIAPTVLCSNPITPGTSASSSGDSICGGSQTILSIQGNSVAGGISYQWESSADSLNWNTLPGGSNAIDTLIINSSGYYRCAQTCSGVTVYAMPIFVALKPFYSCYCASSPFPPNINSLHIGNLRLSNLNNGADSLNYYSAAALGSYSNFFNLAPISLVQNLTYPLRIVKVNKDNATYRNSLLSVFIDYNHNGEFDEPFEKIVSTTLVAGQYIYNDTISIPSTALTGITALRAIIYTTDNYQNGACFTYYDGETEDYLVNIQQGTPCGSPVLAGVTTSTLGNVVCAGTTVLFSLSGAFGGAGQSYQWEYSVDSINWFSIANATNSVFEDSILTSQFYRCKITCGASTGFSIPYKINLNPSSQCYCSAIDYQARYYGADIGKFSLGNFSNGNDTVPVLYNSMAINSYSNFINLPVSSFSRGSTYLARISQITSESTFHSAFGKVFIDFNRDGVFSNTSAEAFPIGLTTNTAGGNNISASIGIPTNASIGITGLRVRLHEANSSFNLSPCINQQSGETEDYLIYIDFANEVNKNTKDFAFSIYPNPAKDQATIYFRESIIQNQIIYIQDLSGKIISQFDLPTNQNSFSFSTQTFASGFYIVELVNNKKSIGKSRLCIVR